MVDSEDEIFALLSHEFGHVYLNHYASNDVKTAGESAAALTTLAWSYANKRASATE
ncbi:M48 family metalloprotease [Candidatus Burkholderia verschuerenii]|uniref:M48 family metalloprotease n=1 Tax=Candidatus Burkholderia verschuerenii TaxID=242163 RepID=UPI0018DCB365|nr:M48 family metalloprotease [Candidatus Burkholderia verschuerenii]